ncbi:MAG: peptidylprolyl isomerase, partial [Kordiimonas sp.]
MMPKIFRILFCLVVVAFAPQAWAETQIVKINTSIGAIELELFPERAPITVANFLRYVEAGKYDGGSFYRVVRMDNQAQNNIKIEVIQGGRGIEEAEGNFSPITHETTKQTGLRHEDGTISMARLAPGTASSEFFICIG